MFTVWIAYEEMNCRSSVNKVSCANRTETALCRLAGDSEQGRVFLLARHGQLHTVAIFSVLNFEKGEELEIALLSISILWPECTILLQPEFLYTREVMYRPFYPGKYSFKSPSRYKPECKQHSSDAIAKNRFAAILQEQDQPSTLAQQGGGANMFMPLVGPL